MYVRLMHEEDIDQVTRIDREVFPALWPPVNYKHELQNRLAHYIVISNEEPITREPKAEPPSGLPRLLARAGQLLHYSRLSTRQTAPAKREYIIGFGGFWLVADEAHIISLAVRQTHQKRGIGELLLIATIELATQLDARIITLEVRASNTPALSLYYKYGFTQVGIRHGYYTDNKEDAILMTADNITSASFQARLQQLKKSHSKRWRVASYQITP